MATQDLGFPSKASRPNTRPPDVQAIEPALAVLLFLGAGVAHGQPLPPFDSGSNGSDGALILTVETVPSNPYLFDPRDFNPPLDQDEDGVYHFTTIEIGDLVIIKFSAVVPMGHRPVVWLASGAVRIQGLLDLDGSRGHPATEWFRGPAMPGAGGYAGGVGGNPTRPAQPGDGPGGGPVDCPGIHSGGFDFGRTCPGQVPYGNAFLLPLFGGSGGGGAACRNPGGGGGAGGGAILIASSDSIHFGPASFPNIGKPLITALGGIHGDGSCNGVGSGGAIRLVAPVLSGRVRMQVGDNVREFSTGPPGLIRLEAFVHDLSVDSGSPIVRSTPGRLFHPNPPSLLVTRIGGVPVPSRTIGGLEMPDFSLNADPEADTTLEVEARNVPPGTKVQIHMWSANGPGSVIESTPLVGTLDRSTATAPVRLPSGLSRFSVQARWDPSSK